MKFYIALVLLVAYASASSTPKPAESTTKPAPKDAPLAPMSDMKWTSKYGKYPVMEYLPLRYSYPAAAAPYSAYPYPYPYSNGYPLYPAYSGVVAVKSYEPEAFYEKNGFYPEH